MGYNCSCGGPVSWRTGVAALTAPLTVVKNVGSMSERWRFNEPMRATSKLRSAWDEDVGRSDLDLLNVTDY